MITLLERAQGCLLGLACGDALGTTVEFYPRGKFERLTDMRGGGQFRLQKGQWTDDTSMALCLADSLLENDFDALDQMNRYCLWANTGYRSSKKRAFGIGKQTIAALSEFRCSGNPFSEKTDSRYSGNGSLMRIAPIALYYFNHEKLTEYAKLSSQTTHASRECIQSCQYFVRLLQGALQGMTKTELFNLSGSLKNQYDCLQHITSGQFISKSENEIRGSGYVIESLEAALWAFWHSHDYASAALQAANLGDDADTTAAICGQIAGAFYGVQSIPENWLVVLYLESEIRNIATQLINHSFSGSLKPCPHKT
ncbi:ADP-ribosylglycohydrolase family protein [Kingella negevensis]|uniref:ADP-ribosylglycohydrolase family protein n=1 Tax=Kingella negevensis TaxID=1522312 RepID=UPI00050A2418|nr:ADP-ribosylglycohydrolase family protein [Kingella negevensis]MDK4680816.1 ADP-ribosylglycohydrolase family protein [Kingella negevensis]MDK4681461.1 ADP-ribosylglycohydrolase family protein [Kingella negevensis]MDK4687883.1 ADP-ribosylglycohydrolase family protein [Kingella negevensis]MDK4691847.1 ADP-ribosylglycohydrolase family protein [Kingella negevensis]MDK4692999.1 ADP-ribosylglycohydrolase family protein [Kingella negevensis]